MDDDEKGRDGPRPPVSSRADRLAAALRANLARRKAQDRARRSQPQPPEPESDVPSGK